MSDKNEIGVTVISHGSEDKTLVDGYEVGGSYSRDIHYNGANMPQLVSLINVSLFCEQLIKYECFSSNMEFAFWVSSDSVERTYWGGAAPDSRSAHAEWTTPAQVKTKFITVIRMTNWQEDSGLLTEKTHLLVKQLRFGDTEANMEQGYYALGKFKCYGIQWLWKVTRTSCSANLNASFP